MTKIISIKCPNCGANIDVDENKKVNKCQYCNTNLLIEKDLNDEIKASVLNNVKFMQKFFPIVFGIVLFIIFTSFIATFMFSSSIFIHSKDNWNVTSFNNSFTYAHGTKTGVFVGTTLDSVIDSNKKNSKHQIYVKYNDIKTNKEDKIIAIKDELETYSSYEVKTDYDKKGYINLITITKK